METLTKFVNPESNIDFRKVVKFKDIVEPIELYLENVDIVLDKIKVSL
jgi:hypothetical protein